MGKGGIQKVTFFMHFQTLTGHDPYPYQIETYEAFAKISSPLLLWERDRMRCRACPELVEGLSSGHQQGAGRARELCLMHCVIMVH